METRKTWRQRILLGGFNPLPESGHPLGISIVVACAGALIARMMELARLRRHPPTGAEGRHTTSSDAVGLLHSTDFNQSDLDAVRIDMGDARVQLKSLPDNSVSSVVTDPPYEIGFAGFGWDSTGVAADVALWNEVLRVLKPGGHLVSFGAPRTYHRMATAVEDAGFEIRDQIMWVFGSGVPKALKLGGRWHGWSTALKPAHEPVVVARKPLSEGTVDANVKRWGTGAINVDSCRVKCSDTLESPRWPANVIHDGSDEVVAHFPVDRDTAARFFYCAKASRTDRDEGVGTPPRNDGSGAGRPPGFMRASANTRNFHPTVKPTELMRYLVRLVTPPGGTVLDPFMGSGSTGKAAIMEGCRFIGIEQKADYADIARARVEHAKRIATAAALARLVRQPGDR